MFCNFFVCLMSSLLLLFDRGGVGWGGVVPAIEWKDLTRACVAFM